MKKFIRVLQMENEDEQIKMRSYLNDMGFYVLSLPNYMLEVNVIEDKCNMLDDIVSLVRSVML